MDHSRMASSQGHHSVEGSRARFVADEQGPRGCGGQEWDWEIALSESGTLDAELLQEFLPYSGWNALVCG